MSVYKAKITVGDETQNQIAWDEVKAEMAAELAPANAAAEWMDSLANARICDLLDMIVDEKVKTEDYNYVVEQLQAMMEAACLVRDREAINVAS